jgi:hypothetical protein
VVNFKPLSFYSRKRTTYTLNRRLGGPHSQFWRGASVITMINILWKSPLLSSVIQKSNYKKGTEEMAIRDNSFR